MPSAKTRLWLITGDLDPADLPEHVTAAPIEPDVGDFIFAFLRLVDAWASIRHPRISLGSLSVDRAVEEAERMRARPPYPGYRGTDGARGGGEAG